MAARGVHSVVVVGFSNLTVISDRFLLLWFLVICYLWSGGYSPSALSLRVWMFCEND